jgi:hypothetical protein
VKTYDPSHVGSIIRNTFRDDTTLSNILREELYLRRKSILPDVAPANFVRGVCQLILTRRIEKQQTLIITTNYDDVLETALTDAALSAMRNKAGIAKIHPRLSGPPRASDRDTLPIYHIHGFVPANHSLQPPDPKIVLSSRDYGADWTAHWSFQLLKHYWRAQWLFVGASFADPHLTFFAAERQRQQKREAGATLSSGVVEPIGVFCLQARDWQEADDELKPSLIEAEISRLRELDVIATPTDYFFQDAQMLREICLTMRRGSRDKYQYTSRLKAWQSTFLDERLTTETLPEFLRNISSHLISIRGDVEALAPRGGAERFKCELWCRDLDGYSLFQLGSSEFLHYDPSRARRFRLTDGAAAAAAFTKGSPECLSAPRMHEHDRWRSFFGAPILIGAKPWYDLPVGALVIASTVPLKNPRSTLIANEEAVRKQLEGWLVPLKRALDPLAELAFASETPAIDLSARLRETLGRRTDGN